MNEREKRMLTAVRILMSEREKRMLTAVRMLVSIADSARDGTEGEIISANWDILGPRFRDALVDYTDCPNYPI